MPSSPTNPHDADAAITDSGFVSLGDAPFYRGSVNTGDGDTALIFASDGQLVSSRRCTSTPPFGWCLRYFISYLRSSSVQYNTAKLNTTCEVHHLAFHTCLFPRFPVLQFGTAFSSLAFSVSPPPTKKR